MKNIYIDFDGTIIDSSRRLYAVYKSIMEEFKQTYLSKDDYWSLKRERQPYSVILSKTSSGGLAEEYLKRFLEKIESPEFLKFDKLINGADKTLEKLKKDNRIILVTLRRLRENLYQELRGLKIYNIFDRIYDNFVEGVNSWEITIDSVKKDPEFNKENSVIIGDTEDTILCARELRVRSFVVLSGIRSEKFLRKFKPDYILNDLNELPAHLTNKKAKIYA